MAGPEGGGAEYLVSDDAFVAEINALSGGVFKRCMQCGTCSVVCPLSPPERPFPRKEMIWASFGLKERLLDDPDIWLCHRCDDCSRQCPRDSRPGDVMNALRAYSIVHFAIPSFLARACSEPRYLLLLLLFPALVIVGALWLAGRLTFPRGEIVYAHFIPSFAIQIGALIFLGFALIGAIVSLSRFWASISRPPSSEAPVAFGGADAGDPVLEPVSGLSASVRPTALDILKHSSFRRCVENSRNYLAHGAILLGFALLIVATLGRAVYIDLLGIEEGLPLGNPVKLSGNVGGLLVLAGCALVISSRLAGGRRFGRGSYFDWSFIVVLAMATLTGFITQWARFAGVPGIAYWSYVVHLVFVFALLVYAPYSKFAHAAYRGLGMLRARQTGRSPVREAPLSGLARDAVEERDEARQPAVHAS